jgi:beta-lactamase superfamily II metal-dependent hydrolase
MLLRSFPANKGDSFLLTWNEATSPHHLLIDAGIPGTYRYIRPELKKIGFLDAIILTHVDYDHIGGLIKLIADEDMKLEGYDLYMNSPELALGPAQNSKVAIAHGVQLDEILQKKGITSSRLFIGFNENNRLCINGLDIFVVSPTKEILDAFLKKWKADQVYNQYVADSIAEEKVARPTKIKLSYDAILQEREVIPSWENDLINASSIAFLASYGDCNLLFLGDANPQIVFEELCRRGYSAEKRLRVNFCKLSHHGSRTNTSRDLLSVIDCHLFYISTDGSGPNYHPDRETIVRIAAYARTNPSKRIQIYTNYPLDLSKVITDEECSERNLSIEHLEIVRFDNLLC